MVHVFDRSYYEEVIAARVHGIVDEDEWTARYDAINAFESILAQGRTVILKVYLHVSKDVQAERIFVVQGPEGAFAVRRTASKDNPEALQGFHAEHLLFLIDEASGIPRHRLRGWHGRSVHTRRKGRYGG